MCVCVCVCVSRKKSLLFIIIFNFWPSCCDSFVSAGSHFSVFFQITVLAIMESLFCLFIYIYMYIYIYVYISIGNVHSIAKLSLLHFILIHIRVIVHNVIIYLIFVPILSLFSFFPFFSSFFLLFFSFISL